ncbi:RcpC/CpaB family pilus assembly protein [Spirillospora sp. NPDC048819]|uniref:RcpC/CpaB family pilus assembly protein n=1 Tax=Spirillospora sp. NPDC048819 TaxID=3155268 RepID=UPI00340963E8
MNARLARLRRPLAALFAAAAAGLALMALRPGPPPSVRVLAAARDLPAGTALAPTDLHHVNLPPAAVPSGALRSGTGRTLAAPMREGEPLTDARVVGDGLLRAYGPGTVATPVRIADADAVRLLHPGDHIDVLTTPAPPALPDATASHPRGDARVVVSSIPVITVPAPDEADSRQGALVVLATTRAQALALAAATAPLTLTITAPAP